MEINFKTLREKIGLTCKDISNLTGIKEGTIRKYECSSRVPINKNLIKLKCALKCSEDDIMNAYLYHKSKNLNKLLKNNFSKEGGGENDKSNNSIKEC